MLINDKASKGAVEIKQNKALTLLLLCLFFIGHVK